MEGDLYMLAAIILCGLGYAEGAKLSRPLGGWQVIGWALPLVTCDVANSVGIMGMPVCISACVSAAWIELFYVSVFSMLLGFVFWYRGLAQGGIASVGQLQLFQPFMGLALAALLLAESVELDDVGRHFGSHYLCGWGEKICLNIRRSTLS